MCASSTSASSASPLVTVIPKMNDTSVPDSLASISAYPAATPVTTPPLTVAIDGFFDSQTIAASLP